MHWFRKIFMWIDTNTLAACNKSIIIISLEIFENLMGPFFKEQLINEIYKFLCQERNHQQIPKTKLKIVIKVNFQFFWLEFTQTLR